MKFYRTSKGIYAGVQALSGLQILEKEAKAFGLTFTGFAPQLIYTLTEHGKFVLISNVDVAELLGISVSNVEVIVKDAGNVELSLPCETIETEAVIKVTELEPLEPHIEAEEKQNEIKPLNAAMFEHLEKLDPLAYKQEACILIDAVGILTNIFDIVDNEKGQSLKKLVT